MSKNKGGRPPKAPQDRYATPQRQLGRVDDETWQALREAAQRAGKPFSHWAVEILLRAAKRRR